MRSIIRINGLVLAVAALCLVVFTTAVQAQSDGGQGDVERTRNQAGDLDRDRDRDQDRTKQYTQDQVQIRNRLHNRIDTSADLTADERAAMHTNVDACLELGIDEAGLDALFPGEEKGHRVSAQTMLRLQNRVMTAAREGLPVEPVMAKIQEGRTKGVPDPLLEKACERMENHVRTAHQIMTRAIDEGFEPPKNQTQERHMNTEMAQQMWRGMKEEGYEQLQERARQRVRAGQCGVEDLAAAGELAPMTEEQSKTWFHLFVSAVYFTPLLGALISDIWLGKYRTILWFSILYCFGFFALALDHTRLGLGIGLVLIASQVPASALVRNKGWQTYWRIAVPGEENR